MEGADNIEMAAGGVAVEGDEDNISKDSGDDNQSEPAMGSQ